MTRASMFIVPADTPGVNICATCRRWRSQAEFGKLGGHAEILDEEVRLPADALLGDEGAGFLIAQRRLEKTHTSQPVIDVQLLATWMDDQRLGDGPIAARSSLIEIERRTDRVGQIGLLCVEKSTNLATESRDRNCCDVVACDDTLLIQTV